MDQEQKIKKLLVFDVWGDFAHFRRGYTTTSPLTFSIPPRTSLCGLISAILGLEKENNEYLKYFTLDKAKIGLRLLKPVKKVNIAENLIDTKTAKGIGMNLIKNRTQIRFEFLKKQRYRVYFWHSDEKLYGQLKENLSKHKTKYTLCLGLSENIANFKFKGEFDTRLKNSNDKLLHIHSVIPTKKLLKNGINFDNGWEYFSVRIPVEMSQERIVTKYSDIIFERNGKPIESKMVEPYWEINYNDGTRENIVFIE
jgi:CRISPR-associated protein Cas5h